MIVLEAKDLSFSYGVNDIIKNTTIKLEDKDRAGLVGANGAGKSTLFKLITGEISPDEGTIFIRNGISIGYLKQHSTPDLSTTLIEEVNKAFSHLIDMENELKVLENDLQNTDMEQNAYQSLIDKFTYKTEVFQEKGGFEYKSRATGILRGLGFNENQFTMKASNLSGGQKTRLELAKILAQNPDILMLDEPTNHLDIKAIEWLEGYLSDYKGCVFIVSHDRFFLDKVTTKIYEIENTHLYEFMGNYTSFVSKKQQFIEQMKKKYQEQQKEIKRQEEIIKRYKQFNREKSIKAAESRQKALDKMELVEKPNSQKNIKFKIRSQIISGNDVLFVENLSKSFDSLKLFDNINFNVQKNEKIFILGPNGCGKSTLLKILTGQIEQNNGTFEYGHKINMGYYDQELTDLNDNNTIIEEAWPDNLNISETFIRNTLAAFLFTDEDVFRKISTLSGGEKSRVLLSRLILNGCNLIILDEPTNHLDIKSREALETALSEYDGTIICVSHDRYFVNRLATRIIEMKDNNILDINGGYKFYLNWRKNQINEEKNSSVSVSQGKNEYKKQKEEQALERKRLKLLENTEEKIADIEKEINTLNIKMADPVNAANHEKLNELHNIQLKLEKELETLYEQWENLTD